MKFNHSRFLNLSFIPFLLFCVFFIFYLNQLKKVPIVPFDEKIWVGESYFFELFIKRDFDNPLWKGLYSYSTPKLTDYIFGATLYPKYLNAKKEKDNKYDFVKFLLDHNFSRVGGIIYQNYYKTSLPNFIEWEKGDGGTSGYLLGKYGNGFSKTIDLIFTARRANAVILALSVLVVYFIGSLSFGKTAGLLTAFFYGFNNLIVDSGLKAHSETTFLLTFNLGLLLLIIIFVRKRKSLILLLLFSIVGGLCMQTKLNGIMLLFFFNFFLFSQIIENILKKAYHLLKAHYLHLLFVNIAFFLAFVLLHPFLYKNPLQNTSLMFRWKFNNVEQQVRESSRSYLPGFATRIKMIYSNFLEGEKISYYYYNKSNILLPQSYHFNNVLFLNQITPIVIVFNFLVFNIGVAYIISYLLLERKWINHPLSLILSLFILTQIIMGFYLKLDWYRYYVQLVFFFVFFQSVGLLVLLKFVYSAVRKVSFIKLK